MNMMLYVYLGILALLVFAIGRELFKEKNIFNQLDAVLVLIPLLLRLLLIK